MGDVLGKAARTDGENQGSKTAPLARGEPSENSRITADPIAAADKDYAAWKEWFPSYIQRLENEELSEAGLNSERLHTQKAETSAQADPEKVLDIAFFHGLQLGDGRNAREKTWTNRDGVCWPRDWLPGALDQDLNGRKMGLMGISYNAQAMGHRTGDYGVRSPGHQRIAKGLFQSLINSERCSLGRNSFVLVGHSYGGIVIKSLVVHCSDLVKRSKEDRTQLSPGDIQAIDAATRFMANFKGCVFYGVPQRGSNLAYYASWTNKFIPLLLGRTVFIDLVPSKQEILDLTRKFETAIQDRGVMQFAFGETKKTGPWGVNCMVVDHDSAQGNLRDTEFTELQGTDHRTVCKPITKEAEGFVKFVEIMRGIITRLDGALPLNLPISTIGLANSGDHSHRLSGTQICNNETQRRAMDDALAFNPRDAHTRAVHQDQVWPGIEGPLLNDEEYATVTKIMKKMLPPDVRVTKDAQDLLVENLVDFMDLILSRSNDICSKEEKRTISREHVSRALEILSGAPAPATQANDSDSESPLRRNTLLVQYGSLNYIPFLEFAGLGTL